ncbi:hypothetical protein CFC21_012984 [Triticum aestivum]|uniref:GRF-type domain-containing protein n=2 Tax=Triticum aestivum TaxID=4565 RepID=A0A9R1DSG1_WHEAT|nr:hypothetical protein CFC21_012984 [Triticum aestivum]
MVSWNDGETSSDSVSPLPHEVDEEPFRPATIEDRDWSSIDATGKHLCKHGNAPERLVVFDGLNTGRRFYGCTEKEGNNCDVVEWVDNEWPYALKNSLTKLWALYKEAKAGRISDNLANEEKVSKLEAEVKMVQEKYNQHIQLTKDFCESVQKSVHKENYRKIMMDVDEEKIPLDAADKMIKLEKENFDLKKEVEMAEEVAVELKKEKKKLEYNLHDLWKVGEENKRKLKMMKAILEE